MKKVLLLLTIFLISCGSEESTGAVEESTGAVEEIVVLETQKKKENSGIEDEDFDEYIAGLEDYGEGGTFVPIPLKLDDFKPFTESGNCLSDDVTIIEPEQFITLLVEAYWGTR